MPEKLKTDITSTKSSSTVVEPIPVVQQEKIPFPRGAVPVVPVAYPTILLALCALITYGATHYLHHIGIIGYGVALGLWTVSAYVSFTPMHDASHASIATRSSGLRWINDVVGHLCSFPLAAPYVAFRYLHLQHHKHTNVPGYDPDMWSSQLSTDYPFLLPLHWWTQSHSYIVHYVRDGILRQKRPVSEVVQVIVVLAVIYVYPYVSLIMYGFESFAFWCYYFPGSLAIMFLAFVFDYIPHRPHGTTDVYKASLITSLTGNNNNNNNNTTANDEDDENNTYEKKKKQEDIRITPLTPILLYQNYHAMHHLYPWVPFYQYSPVWYALQDQFRSKGVRVRSFFPIFVNRTDF